MNRAITACPETYAWLGELVAAMRVDAASLNRPLQRCELSRCRGTCCHDGVYLGPEEAELIRGLVDTSREDFAAMGLDLPRQCVVYGSWRGSVSGPKTAVRFEPKRGIVEDYPQHFPETACVFLLEDARCALQVLARQRGLPPWYYKPLTCWLHPLAIEGIEEGQPRLVLYDEASDPQRFPDYDGFVCRTPCGRLAPEGEPAWQVLREELQWLGALARRDLVGEVRAMVEAETAGKTQSQP